jgi:hypothetical protein
MAEITYSIETVERMLRETDEAATKRERERITGMIELLIEFTASRGWRYKQDKIIIPVLKELVNQIEKTAGME